MEFFELAAEPDRARIPNFDEKVREPERITARPLASEHVPYGYASASTNTGFPCDFATDDFAVFRFPAVLRRPKAPEA